MKQIKLIFIMFLIISQIFTLPIIFANDSHTISEKNALCGANAGKPIKNSFILSVVTLCLPGILEKVNDWEQIKCQRIVCMYNSVKADRDPSFCAQTESYQLCSQVIGEIFAIPPMALLEYFRKLIRNILANPVGIAYAAGIKLARESVAKNAGIGGIPVELLAAILSVNDIMAIVQQIKDLIQNGFFHKEDKIDYCRQVPAIREEMAKIIKATNPQDVQKHLN